jgi:hypothetical protein
LKLGSINYTNRNSKVNLINPNIKLNLRPNTETYHVNNINSNNNNNNLNFNENSENFIEKNCKLINDIQEKENIKFVNLKNKSQHSKEKD